MSYPEAVFIRWRDSMRETGWRSREDAAADIGKSLEAESVGFLVGESDAQLMLALNHQAIDGHLEMVGETLVVPKEAIIERVEMVPMGTHADAGNLDRNHYAWFMPADPTGVVDGYLDSLEAKMTEALTDPFAHDLAQAVLPLIAAYRATRGRAAEFAAELAGMGG